MFWRELIFLLNFFQNDVILSDKICTLGRQMLINIEKKDQLRNVWNIRDPIGNAYTTQGINRG
jgi:hypothetical protein